MNKLDHKYGVSEDQGDSKTNNNYYQKLKPDK